MGKAYHALVLNLHQPSGNLEALLDTQDWEAKEILLALDRIPRSLWGYEDVGRVHLSLSGMLLETLSQPEFQARVYGVVKCGELLWQLQNECLIQVLGTAYYHPVLPLIAPADWPEQLGRWQGIGRHVFWRNQFPGFWPPELGFCHELIPLLKRLGYRYAIVDSEHVEPVTSLRWEELRYRPHIARHDGQEIVVIVRDRQLSDAQLSGMDPGWFLNEVHERTQHCDFPPLVTTATDGDNGGWFRNVSAQSSFWGTFYRPLLDRVRRGESEAHPVFIDDYLNQHGVWGEVRVRAGAWNTGWHSGVNFTQWTESPAQKEAWRRLAETSQALHAAFRQQERTGADNPAWRQRLMEAQWRILRAETSCNFFWGDAWLHRCHHDLDDAWRFLGTPSAS